MPGSPEAVRIDRFVEKHFKVSPRYEALPDGVLGYTAFGAGGVTAIVVTTALDEKAAACRSAAIRTTLAHEAGQGLLQMHLFALGGKPASLFDDGHDRPEILCRSFMEPRMKRAMTQASCGAPMAAPGQCRDVDIGPCQAMATSCGAR